MPRLCYILDPSYDWKLFQSFRKSRGKQFYKEIKTKRGFLRSYRLLRPFLVGSRDLYQTSWNEINDFFFGYIERLTKHPWKFKKYYCVISLFHRGLSSWGGNKIVRSWAENPYRQRKITAHELLISHLWGYLDKHSYKDLPDKKKWAFCEITAWAITGLEERLVKKCWPWITESEKWPLQHNYPQLVKSQKLAKPLYQRCLSFENYTKRLIKKLR